MLPIPIGIESAGSTVYRDPPTCIPARATDTRGSEFRPPSTSVKGMPRLIEFANSFLDASQTRYWIVTLSPSSISLPLPTRRSTVTAFFPVTSTCAGKKPPGRRAIAAVSVIVAMSGVSLGTMQHLEVMLVGSANMDLVVRTHSFPAPGETLQGLGFQTFAGGKGANQAVAAGKLGAKVGILAKLGNDPFGDQLTASLLGAGVKVDYLLRDPTESTGVALITVDDSGQNTIVVAPGTNALLTPFEVNTLKDVQFAVLLAQLEIPLETVIAASVLAKGSFILNPAPARELPNELFALVDYLTPNETEAVALTGILPADDGSCLACARVLLDRGVKNVLFTLGSNGSYLANAAGGSHFPSIKVNPIDTTGAGDAFNGAFAYFLSKGEQVQRSIHLANVAGALATTKAGAQASMPTLQEVLARA